MRLTYQPEENSLRLTLDREIGVPMRRVKLDGYVDMGVGGRIVGVEALPREGLDLTVALRPWLRDESASEYVSLDGGSAYIELSVAEEADVHEQIRAVPAAFTAEVDDAGRLVALSIPRHGSGYEISYPSGNQ
ncbi:MAG: DUF2283 domain-containing protein [Nitrolancea sp.]